MSYLLPHLHSGWSIDQAILAEEERLVVIRFGHDWDETCIQIDEVFCSLPCTNINSLLTLPHLPLPILLPNLPLPHIDMDRDYSYNESSDNESSTCESAKGNRLLYSLPPRPGFGTNVRIIPLVSNHFQVTLANLPEYFYRYRVVNFVHNGGRSPIDQKGIGIELIDLVHRVYDSDFVGIEFIYDGDHMVFTLGSLPDRHNDFPAVLGMNSSTMTNPLKSVEVSFNAARNLEIPLQSLVNAMHGQESPNSLEAIRVFDIILHQHAARQGSLRVRRSFFHNESREPIGPNILGYRGFHSSFRTTQGGMSLNMDVKTTTVIKPGPLIDFLIADQGARDVFDVDWNINYLLTLPHLPLPILLPHLPLPHIDMDMDYSYNEASDNESSTCESAKGNRLLYSLPPHPGFGTNGRIIPLVSIHFQVTLANLPEYFYRYRVNFVHNVGCSPIDQKGLGGELIDLVHRVYDSDFVGIEFIYDGDHMVFTLGSLPDRHNDFPAVLGMNFSTMTNPLKSVEVSFNAARNLEIPLQSLVNAMRGQESPNSLEAIRVLDIILHQHAARQGSLRVRRSFFHNESREPIDPNILGCRGFHSSFRTTQGGMSLNMDAKTTTVIKPGPLSDFLIADQGARDVFDVDWSKIRARNGLKWLLRDDVVPSTHLHSGWAVDQAILTEEERLVVIRFGPDWDETCMQEQRHYDRSRDGYNNKINWAMKDKHEFIDIIETVFRGARKGRRLVIAPKDYSTKYRY
uniref:Argonaute linker 1 domain-containing protein n=1 Tax=Brassica campestris TaxID=3711 RepID=M4CP43_BRACM